MRIEPVRRYPHPKLPTREVADENPELLRLLPKRWQTNPAVLAALIGAGVLMQCSRPAMAEERGVLMGKIAPPRAMLTESEARAVVVDEAKKAGIKFEADKETLLLPLASLDEGAGTNPCWAESTPITLDGSDKKHKISYEYISEGDLKALSARRGHAVSAESVANVIKARGKEDLKENVLAITEVEGLSREEAQKKLRAQVKDFIKWLKAQGVI